MKKLIVSTLFAGLLFAENQNVIVDRYLSPYAGADDLIMAHQLLEGSKVVELVTPSLSQDSTKAKLGRCAELFFLWDPLNYTTMITQHEVFGHGYRLRSFRDSGAHVVKYKIGVPPPYGTGGGYTQYKWHPTKTSVFQESTIATAGVESTAILANKVRMQWLSKQKISPRESTLYLFSQHDLTYYISQTAEWNKGDINHYRFLLNKSYGKGKLSVKDLKNKAYLNLLDPFTFYAFYANWRYILHGQETPIPMIRMGSYQYLPSARLGLTPFGPEYYLENFLVKGEKPIYFYMKHGAFAGHRYSGLGVEYPKLWNIWSMDVGIRTDVWYQPAVNLNDVRYNAKLLRTEEWKPVQLDHSKMGASLSVICQRKLWSNGALFMQVGGKSQGYVPGEELSSGMILRVGVTLW